MKRFLALVLTLCLCIAPVSAETEIRLTTEELFLELLPEIVEALQEYNLGVAWESGDTTAELLAGRDASGAPDVSLSLSDGEHTEMVAVNEQGIRWTENGELVGVAYETLLRALFTDENGVCSLPSVTEQDTLMLTVIAMQIALACGDAVQISEQNTVETGEDGEETAVQTLTVDVQPMKLLGRLDTAVPAALEASRAQLDDFFSRNEGWLGEKLTTDMMIAAWQSLNVSRMLAIETPLRLLITTRDNAKAQSMLAQLQLYGATIAQATLEDDRLVCSVYVSGSEQIVFDSDDLNTLLSLAGQTLNGLSIEALAFGYSSYRQQTVMYFNLDVERLINDFYTSLIMTLQANRAQVQTLLDRYGWLLSDEALSCDELIQALQEIRVDAVRSAEMKWLRMVRGNAFLRNLVGNTMVERLPAIRLEYNAKGSESALLVSTNRYQLRFVTGDGQFSGTLASASNRIAESFSANINGFLGEDRLEAQLDLMRYGRPTESIRLSGWLEDDDLLICELTGRDGGEWTPICTFRMEDMYGRIEALLTDAAGNTLAEAALYDDGFMLQLPGFMAELLLTEDGGVFRIDEGETVAFEWHDGEVVTEYALTAIDATLSLSFENYNSSYGMPRTMFQYLSATKKAVISIEALPNGFLFDGSLDQYGARLWDANLEVYDDGQKIVFSNAQGNGEKKFSLSYRPGVLYISRQYRNDIESLQVTDVSTGYDHANTTRVDYMSAEQQPTVLLIATDVQAYVCTVTVTQDDSPLGVLTLTLNPAPRDEAALGDARWLTERELLSLLAAPEEPAPETEETTEPQPSPSAP